MSARFALTLFARGDLAEARRWYELRRSGLGNEFSADFYEALRVIAAAPTAQTFFAGSFRKRKLERFPYHVFFHIEESLILVVAVIHKRRSSEFVRAQLNRRRS